MIKLNNVSKTIKKRTILEDLSITFEKGTVYLIEGHNGCGKTMLLRLLAGLIQPTSGTIEKDDYTYGVIIETPSFIESESAKENLRILASIRKEIGMDEIEEYLKLVNLLDDKNTKVSKFSLGMKQRLAFCQAVMENPDVLLLDEPFNALDKKNYDVISNYLFDNKKNRITIIAAHGMDYTNNLFDKIIKMDNGHIDIIENAPHKI